MTAVPPPPSTPPPPSPPPAAGPAPVPGAPPPKQGLSTGAKIAIGCGILLVLALIVIGTCTMFVGKKLKDVGESVEDQQKAQETVAELEREHPFTPPADGTLEEDQVQKFFAVTDDAWGKMKDWIEDMEKRGQRIDQSKGQAGFGDAVAGFKGLAQARTALAEAFEDHDMPPSAYVWTGWHLIQAHDAQGAGSASGVPQANLDLAQKYSDRIAELKDEDGKTGKAAVLGLAFTLYPRPDLMLPSGMDTLMRVPR